jgi:hypothetical protein
MRKNNGETVADRPFETDIETANRDSDAVIADVLGDTPRAAYWRDLRLTLAERLKVATQERDTLPPSSPERSALEKRIEELRHQVHVLATEEAVTQFVEDSIRASLHRPTVPGTRILNAYDDAFEEYGE